MISVFSPAVTIIANHISQTKITSYSASCRLSSGTYLEFSFDRKTESHSRLQTDVFLRDATARSPELDG